MSLSKCRIPKETRNYFIGVLKLHKIKYEKVYSEYNRMKFLLYATTKIPKDLILAFEMRPDIEKIRWDRYEEEFWIYTRY